MHFKSLQLKRPSIKLIILPPLRDQLLMGPALDDMPQLQHHDAVGVLDGTQAVGDDEDRAALHEAVHAFLYQALGAGIDR